MTSTPVETTCTVCGVPATKSCHACAGGIDAAGDATAKTFYCSIECQTSHWASHKPICKQLKIRKQLYRAGKTLQGLFYAYRERAFDAPLRNIERFGNKIEIHGAVGKPATERWRNALSDLNTKKAVLSWLSSIDSVLYMGNIVKSMINEISKKTTVACVEMKAQSHHLCISHVDIMPNSGIMLEQNDIQEPRYLFKVFLKHNAGRFALDLAGGEHGYFDPVMPWDAYAADRVETVNYYRKNELPTSTRGEGSATLLNRMEFASRFSESLRVALMKENITMEGLIKLSDTEFEEKKSRILEEVTVTWMV